MVEVAPFVALEYAPSRALLRRVVSPPHDTLTPGEISTLRKADPHNIVHLTLPGMSRTKQKATQAARVGTLFDAWVQGGVLQPTDREVVYAYECEYDLTGHRRRMRGVVARLRIDSAYRNVRPHEEIFPQFSEGRLLLLRAAGADLEPIELLYAGKSAETPLWAYVDGSKEPPTLLAQGQDGALHKFWRISDAAIISTFVDALRSRTVYIADGHHRYHAAVQYADERRRLEYRPPKNAPWEYKMSLLVHAEDRGLAILPTHRIVRRARTKDPARLMEAWAKHFRIERVELPAGNPVRHLTDRVAGSEDVAVGAWLGEPGRGYILTAPRPIIADVELPGKSATYRSLDAVHLQQLALARAFGVPEADWAHDVGYTRDDEEAVAAVEEDSAVAVLVHRPTRLTQMIAMADAGEKMPQKSTYFLPKIISGVCLYPIGRPATTEPQKRRVTS